MRKLKKKKLIEQTIDNYNMKIIREKAKNVFQQRKLNAEQLKKRLGAIDDFRRGQIASEIGSNNIPDKNEYRLHYQIDQYIEWE